jgi:hypothetical protein
VAANLTLPLAVGSNVNALVCLTDSTAYERADSIAS